MSIFLKTTKTKSNIFFNKLLKSGTRTDKTLWILCIRALLTSKYCTCFPSLCRLSEAGVKNFHHLSYHFSVLTTPEE